jgi:UDP-2,3-diacylglucosamine pyrophosphatase LpxH
MPKKHYRSIFISDTHFGYPINRSDLLANFLQHHTCDNLYLVGDIIDFWVINEKGKWYENDSIALREILKMKAKKYYIPGNHDEVIREFLPIDLEGITFANEIPYYSVSGKKFLITHGDLFDSDQPGWKVLSHIGNEVYMFSLWLNKLIQKFRERLGWEPWSLALWLKQNVKGAVSYINKFEVHLANYCKKGGYDGVICGHIHTPVIREMEEGLIYINTGDWVESCTALVENEDGLFELISWDKFRS